MQMFRYAEQGSIKFLWIVATNPAVSLPQLPRIRSILDKDDLFVVVQDAFLTETAQRADVVLPAAIWGEKTGCFTNTDRTVHISYKAIAPPGEYRANDPQGKAILKAADYLPPYEEPNEEYPLWLTTGRLVYHFHTRTKTGHSKELQNAAPDAFVQISSEDAERYGIIEGDMVDIQSRLGRIFVPARVGEIEPGLVFVPFHYGYWDNPGRPRALKKAAMLKAAMLKVSFRWGFKPHLKEGY